MVRVRDGRRCASGAAPKRLMISPAGSISVAVLIMLFARNEAKKAPIASGITRRAQYSSPMSAWEHRSRRKLGDDGKVGVTDIHDCKNVQYTSTIGIGTPSQELKVVLNTGSCDLWVASTECDSCGATHGYDSSASSTYMPSGEEFSVEYIGGEGGTGFLSMDKLTVGGLSTTVTFGEMTTADLLESCDEMDGRMGMGPSNEDGQNTFEDMLDAGAVDVPIFSFFMGNIDENSPTGILTMGGVNQTHYEGCLEWVDVSQDQKDSSDGFWSVVLKDVKLGSESMLRGEATAIIDTATALVVGPKGDIGVIAGKLGAYCIKFLGPSDAEFEEVDCANDAEDVDLILLECDAEFDDINFFFGGDDFALTPSDLLQPLEDFDTSKQSTTSNFWCLFGMLGGEDMDSTWILGDSFLRAFYTAYNVHDRTVGLAPATNRRKSDECDADANLGMLHPSSTSAEDTGGSNAADDDDGGEGSSKTAPAAHEDSGEDDGEKHPPGLVAVVVPAVVGTIVLFSAVVGLVLLGRHVWAGKKYRHLDGDMMGDGDDGGVGRGLSAFEMAGKAVRVPGPEDDFLQASETRGGSGVGGVKRVVLKGIYEEGGEDEVEVDLGGKGRGGQGGSAKAGMFGRLLSRPVAEGFAAFDDDENEGLGGHSGGRQSDI